jgi:hypothetical protein
MRLIGLAVILAIGLLAVPLAPEAQPAGKVHRVGVLSSGSVALDDVGNGRLVFLERLSDLGETAGGLQITKNKRPRAKRTAAMRAL